MKLVCYSLEKLSPSLRTDLHKKLHGYIDFSNSCKYKYKRKGLIHKLRCKRIIDSVIAVDSRDAPELIRLLKKYKAKIHVFSIR